MGYEDSVNLYAGLANDPVNNRDPTGMGIEEDLAAYASTGILVAGRRIFDIFGGLGAGSEAIARDQFIANQQIAAGRHREAIETATGKKEYFELQRGSSSSFEFAALATGELLGTNVLVEAASGSGRTGKSLSVVDRMIMGVEGTSKLISAATFVAGISGRAPSSQEVRLNSSNALEGVERASQELFDAVKSRRTVQIVEEGSEEMRYLDWIGAEANVGGEAMDHILLRSNPSKAALLEEFLHGTQHKLKIIKRLGTALSEKHVKDFMIKHKRLLGLSDEDVRRLTVLRDAGL